MFIMYSFYSLFRTSSFFPTILKDIQLELVVYLDRKERCYQEEEYPDTSPSEKLHFAITYIRPIHFTKINSDRHGAYGNHS